MLGNIPGSVASSGYFMYYTDISHVWLLLNKFRIIFHRVSCSLKGNPQRTFEQIRRCSLNAPSAVPLLLLLHESGEASDQLVLPTGLLQAPLLQLGLAVQRSVVFSSVQ